MIKAGRCSFPNEKHCVSSGSELSDSKDLEQGACSKVQASDAGRIIVSDQALLWFLFVQSGPELAVVSVATPTYVEERTM
jgi:hypothetical protein